MKHIVLITPTILLTLFAHVSIMEKTKLPEFSQVKHVVKRRMIHDLKYNTSLKDDTIGIGESLDKKKKNANNATLLLEVQYFFQQEILKNHRLQMELESALEREQAANRDKLKAEQQKDQLRQENELLRNTKKLLEEDMKRLLVNMTNILNEHTKNLTKNISEKEQLEKKLENLKMSMQSSKSFNSTTTFEDGNLDKRSHIRRYFRNGWESYKLSGWGHAELSYTSKGASGANAFWCPEQTFWDKGATIVSNLDTLYIMDFIEEYKVAKDWVRSSFNLSDQPNALLHVRKTVILFIGGFLSIYALTGDTLFRDKAIHVAEHILPAFEIGGGYSCTWYHTKKGCLLLEDQDKDFDPSPYASLNLEFELLSDITENEVFRGKMKQAAKAAKSFPSPPQSWFRNAVQTDNLRDNPNYDWSSKLLAQSGGTYMDYLLKSWIMGGRENEILRENYIKSIEQAIRDLIVTSTGKLVYATSVNDSKNEERMAHSNCYIAQAETITLYSGFLTGGNLVLGGFVLGEPFKSSHVILGEGIANTCHEAYIRSPSKLAPPIFYFGETRIEATVVNDDRIKSHDFPSQPIETYFILWRLTRNPKYRKWGSEILDRYIARFAFHNAVPLTGIKNVLVPDVDIQHANNDNSNERQTSHTLAETLKYLYLLFSEDSVLPLDQWVFNANGHPFPIKGTEAYNRIVKTPRIDLHQTARVMEGNYLAERIQPTRSKIPSKKILDSALNKKTAVRNLTLTAWNLYKKYNWGNGDLVGKAFGTPALWSNNRQFWNDGVTIVTSLDTLFLMGLTREYKEAKDWIKKNLKSVSGLVHVKKTMLAYVGGLLSCYSLTEDYMFREKAIEISHILLAAYNTTSGLPFGWFSPESGGLLNEDENLMESTAFASLFIEFSVLFEITKSEQYQEINQRILKIAMDKNEKPTSMFRNSISLDFFTSRFWPHFIAQSGGTYVEYLLKSWLLGGRKDDRLRKAFISVSQQVITDLIKTTSTGNITFVGVKASDTNTMALSSCYVGGLIALGGAALGEPYKSHYLKIGEAITSTCQLFHSRSPLGLAPALFDFNEAEPKASNLVNKGYQLTSQTVESYFIMYRLTHDRKYREWGWEFFKTIQNLYNSESDAFEGIRDTSLSHKNFDGRQPGSYFLAETLKYLYLLFSDEEDFSLDEWVFNANGHLLPIKGSIR